MTKNVPLMFHNLKGYDNHLIMQESGQFDVKVSVILNGLEKYTTFTINKNWFLLTVCNLWILVQIHYLRICQIMILSFYHKNL